jgi:hypothetical protein
MSEFRIGPTALINTVIAVVLPLLFSSTPFGWFSTAGGITLLLILLSYDQGTRRSPFQSFSFSAVCALSLTFAAGVVVQRFAAGRELPIWLVVVWAAVTILGTAIDRSRMAQRPVLQQGVEVAISPVQQAAPAQAAPAQPAPIQPAPARTAQPAPARTARTSGIGLGLSDPPAWAQHAREQTPLFETSAFAAQPVAPEPLEDTLERPAIAYSQPTVPAAESPRAPTPGPSPAPPVAPPPPPPSQGPTTDIYVHLMNQGITMLRSVKAEHLGRDIYRIVDSMPADEEWKYQPGQIVRCRKQKLSGGKAMVAYEEVVLQQR